MDSALNVSQHDASDVHSYAKSLEELTLYATLTYFTFATDIIKLILCLCVVAVDIFFICIISNFEKVQTKTNTFIKHYSIFNLTHMVATPTLWFFLERTSLSTYLRPEIYCMIMQVEASCILFCHLFSFGLSLHWLSSTHQEVLGSRLKWMQKHSIRIIYAVGIVQFVIQHGVCFTVYWRVRYIIGHTVYAVILIFLGICNYAEHVSKSPEDTDASFALSIANIMIFFWGPLYLYKELLDLSKGTIIPRYVLLFTMFIPEWLAYGCPIIVSVMLERFDMPFRVVCWSLFKRSRETYYDEKDEKLKESETEGFEKKIPHNL